MTKNFSPSNQVSTHMIPDNAAFISAILTNEQKDALTAILRDENYRPMLEVGDDFITAAARDVLAERHRQIEAEGWTPSHDDAHEGREMAMAAGYYVLRDALRDQELTDEIAEALLIAHNWRIKPPKNYRDSLIKAGALILAEIERLDRATPTAQAEG